MIIFTNRNKSTKYILNLIINNLEISDLEKLNNDLTHLVLNLNQDTNLKDYINDVRTGNISVNNTENIEKIKSIISNLGLVPSDSLISSFLLRFGRQELQVTLMQSYWN